MAIATDLLEGTITLNGDLHGSVDGLAPELTPTGVVPGEYITPSVVVDAKGRMLYLEDQTFDLPCAAVDSCGGVIPGDNINFVAGTSEISVPIATTLTKGVVEIGSGFNLDGDILNVDYPIASTVAPIGVVKVGQGLDVDGSGNLIAEIATLGDVGFGTLGGIEIGTGLDLNDGVANILNIDKTDVNLSELTLAAVGVPGVFSLGDNLTNVGGVVDVSLASSADFGICKGDEITLEVVAGVISAVGGSPAPTLDATASVKGNMQIGLHLSDGGSGIVNTDKAVSNTTYGVVRSVDTNNISITAGQIDTGVGVGNLDTTQNWTAAQTSSLDTLVYGASITPDFSLSNVFELTLTGNTTINAPTNSSNGGTYIFIIKQDGVGSHTVTFNAVYKFNTTPTITTAVNAVDIISIVCLSSTQYVSQHTTDFK